MAVMRWRSVSDRLRNWRYRHRAFAYFRQVPEGLLCRVLGRLRLLTARKAQLPAAPVLASNDVRPDCISPLLATAVIAVIAALLLVFDLSRSLHAPSENKDNRILLQTPLPLVPSSVPLNAAEPSAGLELASSEGTAPRSAHPSAATLRWLPEVPETAAELDDVARDLTRRRAEILELEATLALREAAVRAAEVELNSQLARLEAYQREINKLLGAADAARENQIDQLVKVYESMRAKSAAAIFNQLDLPVIISVAKRMREVRMAAILAAMDPDRARLVTTELARARALPRLN